jgi:L-rhamnose isomerase / sugar isomerase
VWIAAGSNFPGQTNLARAFERYLQSAAEIYAALPDDWTLLIEHKMYEPAFYSTVIQDWGSSLIAAETLGRKALCLVDLGHHAPNVNIEMIVARLIHRGRLGGFHFNDSKYGDDDAGSTDPFRLFLIFNELVDAETRGAAFHGAHMLDQSHNVTDPIESLIGSAMEVTRAYAQALTAARSRNCRKPTSPILPRRRSSGRSPRMCRRSSPKRDGAMGAPSTQSPPTAPPGIATAKPTSDPPRPPGGGGIV